MATKRGKRVTPRTSKPKGKKAAGPAANRGQSERRTAHERREKPVARAVERRETERRTATDRRENGGATVISIVEQAVVLRDTILRSKLTAPDPWAYAAKARQWTGRAQQLVDRAAAGGGSAALRQAIESLRSEVERDQDFQAARRLF